MVEKLSNGSKVDRKFRKLTARETWATVDLLNRVVTSVDGSALYAEGYDDERVAKEALPEFPGNATTTVGSIRNNLFGPLRRVKAEPKQAMSRLAEVEAEIAYLRKAVVWLAQSFDLQLPADL